MKILHLVPGLDDPTNGIAVAAKMIARRQDGGFFDCSDCSIVRLGDYDEVWVHSMWLPRTLLACWRVLRAGVPLVRMPHGCMDPVRLGFHGWKKWLVGPIERLCLRRCNKIVATCDAEKGWIQSYLGLHCPPVVVMDIKRFFNLNPANPVNPVKKNLHLLYLGRQHPLKGLEFLEAAVKDVESVELRVVSNAFGDEKERVWDWCDVLVLPTLSDNFGLVVAEALERGKRVITTDGAPAWGEGLELRVGSGGVGSEIWSGYGGRLIYLKGYRDGTDEERVELLKRGILFLAAKV